MVPAWLFLAFFFTFFFFISVVAQDRYYFSFSKIFQSFALTNGIGYVWIIKVSFLVAVVSPIILKINNQIARNGLYFLFLIGSYGAYAFLLFIHDQLSSVYNTLDGINHYLDGVVRTIYDEFIIYGLSYSLIAALGIRLSRLSAREVTGACLLFGSIFLLLGYQNNHLAVQAFKYPPRLYYISYGLFVSLLLYRLLDFKFFKKYLDNQLVFFFSKNSAWVYFWHIVFVYFVSLFRQSFPTFIADTSLGRFLFIMGATLVVTYIHQQTKGMLKNNEQKTMLPNSRPIPQPSTI